MDLTLETWPIDNYYGMDLNFFLFCCAERRKKDQPSYETVRLYYNSWKFVLKTLTVQSMCVKEIENKGKEQQQSMRLVHLIWKTVYSIT